MRHVVLDTNYIVTEDSHFGHIRQITFPRLNVLTLDEFSDLLE